MVCSNALSFRAVAAALAVVLLSAGTMDLQAAPLNLVSTHPGDVASFFTDVHYTLDANPATGTLTAIGEPGQFDVNNQNIFGGLFNLSVTLDRATGSVVSGQVSITGTTDGLPFFSGLLIQGSIIDFGFHDPPVTAPAGSIFEFVFNVTGGALAGPYYTGGTGGIILNFVNGSGSPNFTGVFTAPFANDGFSGFSDTFPTSNIPEPSTLALLGLGLVALVWRLARKPTR